MVTVKLEEIVRQKDPELKNVVEQLARGSPYTDLAFAIGYVSRAVPPMATKTQRARIERS